MSATLALETSGDAPSIALAIDNEIRVVGLDAGQRGLTGLFPLIAKLLRDAGVRLADISLLCYARGPGSFTGLRTAATIARTLHWSSGCRVVSVSTLEVIAHAAISRVALGGCLAPVLDARGGRVFAAAYQAGGVEGLEERITPSLFEVATLISSLPENCTLCGSGAGLITAFAHSASLERQPAPTAGSVLERGRVHAAAGRFCRPEQIVPEYLRPPECEEVFEARRAAAIKRRGN